MKIKHFVAVFISAILLSSLGLGGIAPALGQRTPSGTKEVPWTQKERQELEQRREKERIQKQVDDSLKNSREVRTQVQNEVSRAFGLTTSLLNLLLGLLVLFPIAGILTLWWLKRNLSNQIKQEVKQEIAEEVKGDLVRSVRSELEPLALGTGVTNQGNDEENVGNLKDLISMAMATQNLIAETRNTLEQSAHCQTKAEQLLKQVFEQDNKKNSPPPSNPSDSGIPESLQPPANPSAPITEETKADSLTAAPIVVDEQVKEPLTAIVYEPVQEPVVSETETETLTETLTETDAQSIKESVAQAVAEVVYEPLVEVEIVNDEKQATEAVVEVVYEPLVQPAEAHANNHQGYHHEPVIQKVEQAEEDDLNDQLLEVEVDSNQSHSPQQIIADAEQAIQSNHEDFRAWCGKGIALTQLGRFEEALGAFNKALQFNSEYAEAWYEKARCYSLQGKIDSAIENLKRSIHLNPDNKAMAKTDPFFQQIRQNISFEEMIAAR